MARQGRMHSSPFHVESPQYKYAIEHENKGYPTYSETVSCDQLHLKTKCCRLWNAKQCGRRCLHYKCAYHDTTIQRDAACVGCAFFYNKRCFHFKCPFTTKVDVNSGRYCSFYLSAEEDRQKYQFIQICCERIMLTRLVKECKKKLKSKNLAIGTARREIQNPNLSKDDKLYLSKKIHTRRKERNQIVTSLKQYSTRLPTIGGELTSFKDTALYHQ